MGFFPAGYLSYKEFIQGQSIVSTFICNYSHLYHILKRKKNATLSKMVVPSFS